MNALEKVLAELATLDLVLVDPAALADRLARISADLYAIADIPHDTHTPLDWPKTCPCCARRFAESSWNSLKLRGYVGAFQANGRRYAVQLRDCVCGSTIGLETELPMVKAPSPASRVKCNACKDTGVTPPKPRPTPPLSVQVERLHVERLAASYIENAKASKCTCRGLSRDPDDLPNHELSCPLSSF